jgi:hypothetical protein
MDAATLEMVLTAYDETSQDARAQGHPEAVAHKEGLTAAAMCLAAMTGVEDAAALAQVERLDFAKALAA